ncbi:hypothetical protein GCK72_022503 [Caenorhabditis remanei]|uniref:Uncharacterized protein n=1 Tax=Caenorhabditis remanei TaxID=31234 RepID=A0A6A5FUJ2_CAERE|nr:hypothetical protein GCK72_022502 [Caenorhabditis remanei]XP_053578433.1 hypothetical protein GCK72_022503 [Caenorhabditis remanei]KAF1746051.1 hypothetical protein GCK72_022502 [Caenorhabditis remanei]KAF1746052.1 hypothetical protein GCK72_022503 [Caenorhabditis remanei]
MDGFPGFPEQKGDFGLNGRPGAPVFWSNYPKSTVTVLINLYSGDPGRLGFAEVNGYSGSNEILWNVGRKFSRNQKRIGLPGFPEAKGEPGFLGYAGEKGHPERKRFPGADGPPVSKTL